MRLLTLRPNEFTLHQEVRKGVSLRPSVCVVFHIGT